ncbi:unnamed protein product [Bursaphelenchus okinawaensis]|uniref:Ubiquitin-like-conjugating enzyme ATG3 n=1 Tax=Bursaphelenchus okinawaensis TaxID=465554 RepID=A0A811KTG3_9BILA|nr:unnamed protein product [Bursaphelenchus okinawaensis]CAG9110923.1 unnamed protein product [Bursaphelenchus okinawaensis]
MENLVNSMKSAVLSVGEKLTPVLKQSKFRETGVLTPEEFVAAGDHLVHHCPTWSWSRAGDPSRIREYLPADKQFLITKRVPCHKRCAHMQYDSKLELVIKDDDGNDEWVDTHHYAPELVEESKSADEIVKPVSAPTNQDEDDDDDDDGPAMDMDNFMENGDFEEEVDPNCYKPDPVADESGDDNILKTRTYDLHITYDKYYQVPRLWVIGYDENGKPLTVKQMYEDFSADHANKTITIESHPHLNLQMASIHPCRHAEVMKNLIEQYADAGKELSVLQYLLIFLKFVQTIIPTIEYDFTRSIQI